MPPQQPPQQPPTSYIAVPASVTTNHLKDKPAAAAADRGAFWCLWLIPYPARPDPAAQRRLTTRLLSGGSERLRPSAHLWSAPFPLAGCCPGGKSPAVARAVHCNQQRGELKATMRGALRESLRPPVRAASHLSESLGCWWLACTRSFCSRRAAPGRAHAPARSQCRPCSGLAGSRGFAELRTATPGKISDPRPATLTDPGRPIRPGNLQNARPGPDICHNRDLIFFLIAIYVVRTANRRIGRPGLAGSRGLSGRGAPKRGDPGGIADHLKNDGVAL